MGHIVLQYRWMALVGSSAFSNCDWLISQPRVQMAMELVILPACLPAQDLENLPLISLEQPWIPELISNDPGVTYDHLPIRCLHYKS